MSMSAPKPKPVKIEQTDPDIQALKEDVGDANALQTLQKRLAAEKARTGRQSLIVDLGNAQAGSGLQV